MNTETKDTDASASDIESLFEKRGPRPISPDAALHRLAQSVAAYGAPTSWPTGFAESVLYVDAQVRAAFEAGEEHGRVPPAELSAQQMRVLLAGLCTALRLDLAALAAEPNRVLGEVNALRLRAEQ